MMFRIFSIRVNSDANFVPGKRTLWEKSEKGCACFGVLSKWPKGNLVQRSILACL